MNNDWSEYYDNDEYNRCLAYDRFTEHVLPKLRLYGKEIGDSALLRENQIAWDIMTAYREYEYTFEPMALEVIEQKLSEYLEQRVKT